MFHGKAVFSGHRTCSVAIRHVLQPLEMLYDRGTCTMARKVRLRLKSDEVQSGGSGGRVPKGKAQLPMQRTIIINAVAYGEVGGKHTEKLDCL